MLQIFSKNTANVIYRQKKNLKELIPPSLFPRTIKDNNYSTEKCNRRCDICKNFLVLSTECTCHTTKRKYKIRRFLTCNTKHIYLIACKYCGKQYIGSATGFKERLRIHKSDINTGKIRFGVASYLLNVCKSATSKTEYLQVQLIEHVLVREGKDADKVFWEREKYWQAQPFTLTHGLNNMNEWCALNRRGYRKKFLKIISYCLFKTTICHEN